MLSSQLVGQTGRPITDFTQQPIMELYVLVTISVPAVLKFRELEGTNRIGLTSWNWLMMLQLTSRARGALYQDKVLIFTGTVESVKNEHWELLGLFS